MLCRVYFFGVNGKMAMAKNTSSTARALAIIIWQQIKAEIW
jgi:hypothetical protein